jgi:hypothetical protein
MLLGTYVEGLARLKSGEGEPQSEPTALIIRERLQERYPSKESLEFFGGRVFHDGRRFSQTHLQAHMKPYSWTH